MALVGRIWYSTRMGFFASTKPSRLLLALPFVGLIAPIAATKVVDLDLWWHLATGWVIRALGEIPRNDIFSYSAFGAPWVNHEWLFELGAWFAYDTLGIAAITALKVVLTAFTAFLIFRTISLIAESTGLALWGTAAMLWAISTRVMERPYMLGLCFLALFGLIIHRHMKRGGQLIWVLPALQVIWINSHGGALLGPQLVLIAALGESLQRLAARRFGGPDGIPAERIRALWIAGLATIAACTINPWGFDTLLFPFEHLKMEAILSGTEEWLPLLHPHLDNLLTVTFAPVLLGLTLLVFCLNPGRTRLSNLFLTALMSFLLLKSHRFTPDFVVIVLPVACAGLADLVRKRVALRFNSFIPTWINIAVLFALSAFAMVRGIPVTTDGGRLSDIGIGALDTSAPARLVDFLEANDIRGRVFNEMGLGGYLIFRRWPKEKVFIDGRTPVFGDEFYERFVDAFRTGRNFEELERQYNFDYIVVSGRDIWNQRFFHKYLWERPDWKLVYMSGDGIIYLKDVPRFRALIEKYGARRNPLVEEIEKDEEKGSPAKNK